MDGAADKRLENDGRKAEDVLSKEDQMKNGQEEESIANFALKRHIGLVSGVNFMLSFVLGELNWK
jgi:hypothetical protein